jgi:hypothetical protein
MYPNFIHNTLFIKTNQYLGHEFEKKEYFIIILFVVKHRCAKKLTQKQIKPF